MGRRRVYFLPAEALDVLRSEGLTNNKTTETLLSAARGEQIRTRRVKGKAQKLHIEDCRKYCRTRGRETYPMTAADVASQITVALGRPYTVQSVYSYAKKFPQGKYTEPWTSSLIERLKRSTGPSAAKERRKDKAYYQGLKAEQDARLARLRADEAEGFLCAKADVMATVSAIAKLVGGFLCGLDVEMMPRFRRICADAGVKLGPDQERKLQDGLRLDGEHLNARIVTMLRILE